MHDNTIKVIHWIWGEPKLADFLRKVAVGEGTPPYNETYEWGDEQLAECVVEFVLPEGRSRGSRAWNYEINGNEERATALYEELTKGRKTPLGRLEWIGEIEWNVVRDALLGDESDTPLYVHSTIKDYHPNNRYRVSNKFSVYEMGWSSPSGLWGLTEQNRQVCPRPDLRKCGCTVVQYGR